MKIKTLKLRNFRQFMEMDLEFSVCPTKNVSVIIAENSTGKTTLMQSIKWCLYGDEETELDNKLHLLNKYVQQTSNKEKENLSVQLVIEEEGIDYEITRAREVYRKSNKIFKEIISIEFKDSSGETKILTSPPGESTLDGKKINRMINKILTKEMSHYFLFDGERINDLGNNNAKSRSDIRNAIGAINGFNILDNSLRALTNMKRFYKSNLSEGTNDKKIKILNNDMIIHEDLRKDYKLENNKIQKEIKESESKINRLDNELSLYDQIQDLTKQRKELEGKIAKNSSKLQEMGKNILFDSYNYRTKMMMGLLNEKYRNIDFNEEYDKKTISSMQASAIDEIIKRGVCICGEKITDRHKDHLLEQRNYQPPISNSQLVRIFQNNLKDEMAGMNTAYQYLQRLKNDYIETIDNMGIEKESLLELSDKIGNNDSITIKQKNNERLELKNRISELSKRKNIVEYHIENEKKELSTKEKLYKELINEKNKNIFNEIKYDLVDDSIMILEERNKKDRIARKHQIEEIANNHFSEIIYKNKKLSLNDNFEYSVTEADGSPASPSEGERISISMSLILAIIDAHKEIIKEKNKGQDYDYSNEKDFAIILDAAFATLDNQFSKRISEKLPQSVEQLILFSTERQYKGPVEDSLEEHIGKKYKLSIPKTDRENALTNEELEVL